MVINTSSISPIIHFQQKNCEKTEKGEKEIHSYHHNAEIHVPLDALTVMNFKSLSRHKYFLTFMTHSIQVWPSGKLKLISLIIKMLNIWIPLNWSQADVHGLWKFRFHLSTEKLGWYTPVCITENFEFLYFFMLFLFQIYLYDPQYMVANNVFVILSRNSVFLQNFRKTFCYSKKKLWINGLVYTQNYK